MELMNDLLSIRTTADLYRDESSIFLDDGHGWETEGKRSNDGDLRENEFNSSMVARLSLLFGLYGYSNTQLAPLHKDIPLATRSAFERKLVSKYKDIGIKRFAGISIHADWYKDGNASGITVFNYTNSKQGKRLAEYVNSSISELVRYKGFKIKSRGVKEENFHILRETSSPFILIECGFMSNTKDLQLLESDSYRNVMSIAIFQGVINFISNYYE